MVKTWECTNPAPPKKKNKILPTPLTSNHPKKHHMALMAALQMMALSCSFSAAASSSSCRDNSHPWLTQKSHGYWEKTVYNSGLTIRTCGLSYDHYDLYMDINGGISSNFWRRGGSNMANPGCPAY